MPAQTNSNSLTQQQYDTKLAMLHAAASLAALTCPPGTIITPPGQSALSAEASAQYEHCRCYQFLLECMADETEYWSPPVIGSQAGGGAGALGLTGAALLAAVQKSLANPAQATSFAASLAQLLGITLPAGGTTTSVAASPPPAVIPAVAAGS
jgi:hypothetical protein